MGNDWTCEPRMHSFVEAMRDLAASPPEPMRLYCQRCGWVRTVTDPERDAGIPVPPDRKEGQ